jgi:hypothetical protein
MILEAFMKTIFDTYITILMAFAAAFLVLANHCLSQQFKSWKRKKLGSDSYP